MPRIKSLPFQYGWQTSFLQPARYPAYSLVADFYVPVIK